MKISKKWFCGNCKALKKTENGYNQSGVQLYKFACILGYKLKGDYGIPEGPCPKPLDLTELHVAKITMMKRSDES
jgi:hypothetical protein